MCFTLTAHLNSDLPRRECFVATCGKWPPCWIGLPYVFLTTESCTAPWLTCPRNSEEPWRWVWVQRHTVIQGHRTKHCGECTMDIRTSLYKEQPKDYHSLEKLGKASSGVCGYSEVWEGVSYHPECAIDTQTTGKRSAHWDTLSEVATSISPRPWQEEKEKRKCL